MAAPKLKPEYKDKVVGYNGRLLPLGKRDDLHILAALAKRSGDKSLLELFDETPTEKAEKEIKTSETLKTIRKATGKNKPTDQ